MTTATLQPNEFLRRSERGDEFRAEAMRLRIELGELRSRDGHDVKIVFHCSARVADSRSDRQMFLETLLRDQPTVRREDVEQHFARHARDGASKTVAESDAAATDEKVKSAIQAAIDAVAFACGMILLPPFEMHFESSSLRRQEIEQQERNRAEARSAGQIEHLKRAGELMKQFEAIRVSSSIEPGKVLEQIAPADRGATLESLLLASSQNSISTQLWMVAGSQLAKIDPQSQAVLGNELPTSLGPLRSVQSSDGMMLIGAQTGVMALDPNYRGARLYSVGDASISGHGFNSAVLDNGTIWATHKDHGLIGWEFESAKKIESVSASGAGNLRVLSPGVLAFSVAAGLMIRSNGESRTIESRIIESPDVVSIQLDASHAYVVCEDGRIDVLDRATGKLIADRRQQRGGRICAASALPWMGSIRLLLCREDGAIDCIGADDQLVTQFTSAHRACRMLAASASLVAAVSSDRQRVILWHPWDGRRPFAEIHVTSQTRHRIANVTFAKLDAGPIR